MMQDKLALTINEASEYTGIGRNTLRDLIRWDKLPVIRVGNKVVIRRDDLDRFLSENRNNNLRNRFEVIELKQG
ncbi:helix-turn-helix domain-containing protein [Lachnoclostridium sp. An76]|uniref:helix-turn-helix domain-containing protein n=1 Tax=Lachnoclostridium sp. An76 TaxID=1965654 RepID=UPI000B39968A|nr:helix-turn-helix domain-containing protein [Lachnoclostridium sp. An76]OUN34543.1 MerR family transcriptional regulator [Lachnoclostridium sp. An76]